MRFLNVFNILSLIISTLLFFMSLLCSGYTFGYGSSNSVITPRIQEGFLTGFQLGISQFLDEKSQNTDIKIKQINDSSPLGAVNSANILINEGVKSLFGFPGSTDALLVGKIAKEHNILYVAPGCNHEALASFGDTVYSTGHSSYAEVSFQLRFIKENLHLKHVLVIINPMAAPSAVLGPIFKNVVNEKNFSGIALDVTYLNDNLSIPDDVINEIKKKKYQIILFTPYPEASTTFVNQLIENKIDLPVIAGSAWGTVDSDIMRRFVAFKKTKFYMATSWNPNSDSSLRFRNLYKSTYVKEPNAESAFGYDLGIIAGTTLKRISGQITKDSILNAFKSNLCFEKLSIGKLCFNKGGGHAKRSVNFMEFTKQGFKLVREIGP